MAFLTKSKIDGDGTGHYPDERYPVRDNIYTAERIGPPAGHADVSSRIREAPPLVKKLAPGEREYLEAALRRKIDLRLLPMVVIIYIMNYLDRNNIAAARLAGLEDDLHLTGTQFSTAVSILFVGYLLMQIPSNIVLNKIEAAYFPGCLFYLSSWYTRKELGLRTAILFSGSLISGAFSGLIAAGITDGMDGVKNLRAWRWLFILEGVVTVIIAFGAYFILPDFPRTTTWLTEEERQLAAWRLEEDIGEDDWVDSGEQTLLHGLKLAVMDIKTWILMVMLFCIVASASVTNFFPTVVATLKYNNIQSLLLTAPPYVLAVITSFANAWHADRTGERYFHITLPFWVAVAAFILAAATTATGPRYVAMMLMVPGVYTGYVVGLAWISNTIPRPPAKRAAALAAINAVSNTSSIYASYMYPPSDGPRYVLAMAVNCGTALIAVISATVLRVILRNLNRRLDAGKYVSGAVGSREGVPGAAEKGFRFLL
ncbi:MAG: hypothetical protein M1836_001851 [Candelina mexicana]|nr:MAG: hypothetical protein M1836_001851 [Candelina mexicana]